MEHCKLSYTNSVANTIDFNGVTHAYRCIIPRTVQTRNVKFAKKIYLKSTIFYSRTEHQSLWVFNTFVVDCMVHTDMCMACNLTIEEAGIKPTHSASPFDCQWSENYVQYILGRSPGGMYGELCHSSTKEWQLSSDVNMLHFLLQLIIDLGMQCLHSTGFVCHHFIMDLLAGHNR